MSHRRRPSANLLATATLLTGLVACGDDDSPANDVVDDSGDAVGAQATCPVDGDEWEVAKLYIEHNATDTDTGVHGFFGGEAWSLMCLTDPNGAAMLTADPLGNFDRLAVSDLFFESREPDNDEYPIEQIRDEFPEGDYTVAGVDFDGRARVGAAVFTHAIPSAPAILAPPVVPDADHGEPPRIPASALTVEWGAVTDTIDGDPVAVTGYEVIVTDEESSDDHGFARPVYDVHVAADQRSLSVPDDFLRPATLYELEVLAIEESGNQTISVGFFMTE